MKGEVVMGIAYIILVAFIIVFAGVVSDGNFDEFSKWWGLFGTIVGVITGVIPAFFFKAQADAAKAEVERLRTAR